MLEKKAFPDEEMLPSLIEYFEKNQIYFEVLSFDFPYLEQNDIYSRYTITVKESLAEVDSELIFPAPEKLIKKYMKKQKVLIVETPEFYKTVNYHEYY